MPKRLRPLTGLDALFVYLESMGTPMHVASLIRVVPAARQRRGFANALREHLVARLADVPMLRQRLVDAPFAIGHPLWQEIDAFAADLHVRLETLRKPGTDAHLQGLVARLHATELDRSRPLWEVVVIDGLSNGDVAVYFKSHHALIDGQAGVQVMGALLDVEAKPLQHPKKVRPDAATALPPSNDLASASLRASAKQLTAMLRGVPESVRRLAAGAKSVTDSGKTSLQNLRDSVWLAPRTPFNTPLGPGRRFAAESLPLSHVKRVAKHFGVSLNDVVMTLCSGALRTHLMRHKALPDAPLIAAMPVSLRAPGVEGGNEVSMVQCPLATDIAGPVNQLLAIQVATRQIKGRLAAFKGLLPTDFPGVAAPIWATGLSRLWQRGRLSERLPPLANLVISNVPGPPIPVFLGGAPVSHFHPVSIVTHGLGLNITVMTYAGSLEVGIVSAKETLDKPAAIARGMRDTLAKLVKAVA